MGTEIKVQRLNHILVPKQSMSLWDPSPFHPVFTVAGHTREHPVAEGKPEAEPHRALVPLEEACVSPRLDVGVVITEGGNMIGWKIPRHDAAMSLGRNKN